MDENKDRKVGLIKQIFNSMTYENINENMSELRDWLKAMKNKAEKDVTPDGQELAIKDINTNEILCNIYLVKKQEAKNEWAGFAPIKKAEIIFRFGTEIKHCQKLFVQLEASVRGILSKDTKKALPLLTDCFHYYSSFSVKYNAENPAWKPEGAVVAIISDENSLTAFGYILGPALAAGYNIILQTGPQLVLLASLLIEIAAQVGVPADTIQLVPENTDPNDFFEDPNVSVITIFDNLHNEKYQIANQYDKKLINLYSFGVPMIVFDNCDLDSACYAAVNAGMGSKGLLPWAVRNIFVQEDIFEPFIYRLKQKFRQLRIGKSDTKNVDVSSSFDDSTYEKLTEIVELARSKGVEIYQPNNNNVPVLFIGGDIFTNDIIRGEATKVPIVIIKAFRTISEAVALSNNTSQGLAASVWTESTSLAQDLIGKLKVGTVWVNSHGLFSADVPFSPYKSSGNACFGGSGGFYEYIDFHKPTNVTSCNQNKSTSMESAIEVAKKAQDDWSKLDHFDRIKNLYKVALEIDRNKPIMGLPENWLEQWTKLIYEYLPNPSSFKKMKNYNVISVSEPYGIIAIETAEDVRTHSKELIIGGLIEGNSVIILNEAKNTTDFYLFVAKLLPKGILTIVENSPDVKKVAALHNELQVFFGEGNNVFCTLPLKTSKKFKAVGRKINVTLSKSIWFNKQFTFM